MTNCTNPAAEAATVAAMHEQCAPDSLWTKLQQASPESIGGLWNLIQSPEYAPEAEIDLEYTPFTDPLPALVPAAQLDAMRAELETVRADHAALAAANRALNVQHRDTLAQLDAARATVDAMRADLDLSCGLLRGVRYVMTVGDINHARMVCDAVEARWALAQQPKVQP